MARIMVVEDEPITAADLEQKLTALGHEVTAWLDTGEDVVAEASTQHPDLVLMDIRLRGAMSGIEAAEQLRAQSDVPVVYLTAFSDQETVDRACATQPYGYLLKPFTERSVATAVQVALTRARAEQGQREREQWVSAALRGAGEALVAVDATGAIRFVNEHAESLLQVKEHEVVGQDARSVVRFVAGDKVDSVHPLDSALRESQVTSATSRGLLPAGGGTPIQVSFSAAPVVSARGDKAGAILVFREAMPRAEAAGSQPFDVLSKFSRQLSHEINNPLTYNLGALHLALRELDQLRAMSSLSGVPNGASTAQREQQLLRIERLLRDAHDGATRVAGVMRELGSLSQAEQRRTPLLPAELLDLAIGLSGIADAQHLRLVRRIEPAPMVRGNKWQLSRALAHALQSAVEPLSPNAAEKNALEICVGTDARGWAEIRAQTHPQTSSDRKATPERARANVGMAMAEHVVASLGGELVLRDQDDGRVLTLRLPPMSFAVTERESDASSAKAAPRGSVLIVDDEPMIGRVLQITLQSEHDVTIVSSAESALALLEQGDAFDVILCDLSMPGMDGQQFYERLCDTRPDIAPRVIFMSGGACTERAARFLERMRGRRIDKPFRADQLLPLLSERVRARRTNPSHAQA